MKDKSGFREIDRLCRKDKLRESAEEYIVYCAGATDCFGKSRPRLPNVSGFFRWLGLEASALDYLRRDHPGKYRTLQMIFEDEALNSSLPPSVVSTYMKYCLRSDAESAEAVESRCGPITLVFDHDVVRDGE